MKTHVETPALSIYDIWQTFTCLKRIGAYFVLQCMHIEQESAKKIEKLRGWMFWTFVAVCMFSRGFSVRRQMVYASTTPCRWKYFLFSISIIVLQKTWLNSIWIKYDSILFWKRSTQIHKLKNKFSLNLHNELGIAWRPNIATKYLLELFVDQLFCRHNRYQNISKISCSRANH